MAGLVSRLPLSLSGRAAGAGSALYSLSDIAYHVAIGGQPFMLGIDPNHPMVRGLAQVRKEQFDNEHNPGEQSLANWWLRSQTTFLGGAGMIYQDPDLVQSANLRNRHAIQFGSSAGVDTWTDGQATLLHRTVQRVATGTLVQGYNDGTDRMWIAAGAALSSDDGTTTTSITWGGANTIQALTTDGTNYFAADSVGIYSAAGAAIGALKWNTGNANVTLGWVKGRLMAGIGPAIYELVGGAPPALPAAKFTNLNPNWRWTAIAEGTNAIYAAGYAGSRSAVYKFTLDATGVVPTLSSGGIITCQLPQGEVVNALTTYLGTFVGIGTSQGFRVGQIDSNGDLSYGPLNITNSAGVQSVAAYDRFFYATATNGIDGQSGLYRIDAGQPVADNGVNPSIRFAYATDLQAHVTGAVTSVTNFGNSSRLAFCVAGQGTYLQHATELEATGYVETGRIRFNTLEPKLFKFISVKTPSVLMGAVSVSIIDPGGGETSIITSSQGAAMTIQDVALAAPSGPAEWIQVKLTLTRSGSDLTQGGQVNGWQIKAIPGAVRQRVFTLPLLLFDIEKDIHGQDVGYEGRTLDRLRPLEQIVQNGDVTSFQDLVNNEVTQVIVDEFEFRQTSPPGIRKGNFGGYATIQIRTIADVIAL